MPNRTAAAAALEQQAAEASASLKSELETAAQEKASLDRQLVDLRAEVVVTEETALLQEAGIYEYQHPLEDSVEYQDALKSLRERIKSMAKTDGGAVKGSTD